MTMMTATNGHTLTTHPGAPHGITDTLKNQLNQDWLAFLRA
jgi:non-heme chloroperoxidase